MIGITNDELKRIWKEAALAYFKTAPYGEAEVNQKNFHPGQSVFWLRLKSVSKQVNSVGLF
jgi:hypothetical protein